MLKIQYRDAKDGGIEVLRCFSKEDQVEIPRKLKEKELRRLVIMHFLRINEKKTKRKEIMIGEDFWAVKMNRCFVGRQ